MIEKKWDNINSDNLARFWLALSDVRKKIENEILPYAAYQDLPESDEMLQTLELASSAIEQHQKRFRLQGGRNG